MRSVKSKLIFLFLLVLGILAAFPACALAEDSTSSQLEEIKTRLTAIEQQQKKILDNQDQVFEKLDQLRIWVHRK